MDFPIISGNKNILFCRKSTLLKLAPYLEGQSHLVSIVSPPLFNKPLINGHLEGVPTMPGIG